MGYWDHDYSHLPIGELTEQLEGSLFRHVDLVDDNAEYGGLLAGYHEMWAEAVAAHPDPIAALVREVEDRGGIPAWVNVFDDETGGVDLLSLLILVSLRRSTGTA
ncbi:hypothetical protein [Nocardia nova]|uniref:hypothetical protein n=1 Tax=Nocardia nova TaxID=37330 RepID=UPI0033D54454